MLTESLWMRCLFWGDKGHSCSVCLWWPRASLAMRETGGEVDLLPCSTSHFLVVQLTKALHDTDVTWVDLDADASPSGFPTKGFHRRVRMMSLSPDTESQKQSQPAGLWIWHTSVVILSHLHSHLTHQSVSHGIFVLVSWLPACALWTSGSLRVRIGLLKSQLKEEVKLAVVEPFSIGARSAHGRAANRLPDDIECNPPKSSW